MLRYLKIAFLAIVGLGLLLVAVANRGPVTIRLLPDELAGLAGIDWAVEAPLYAVIFGGVIAGVLVGFVWEWLREHKHRAAAAARAREVARLEREVQKTRAAEVGKSPDDEVLALLDDDRRRAG